jgi:8-oxo-dGTP pyrophosphatase MutT (NUDIX family)
MAINPKSGRLRTTALVVQSDFYPEMFLGTSRRDNYNLWGFPGGKTEDEEHVIACAQRELTEETGLIALDMDLIDVRPYDNPVNGLAEEVWLYQVVRWRGELYTDAESMAKKEGLVRWITAKELLEGTFAEYNEAILRQYYGLA